MAKTTSEIVAENRKKQAAIKKSLAETNLIHQQQMAALKTGTVGKSGAKKSGAGTKSGSEASGAQKASTPAQTNVSSGAQKASTPAQTNVSSSVKDRMTVGTSGSDAKKEKSGLLPAEGKWLKKGSDNVISALLASALDAISDVGAGFVGAPEAILKGGAAIAPMMEDFEFYQNGGVYTLNRENAHKQKVEQAKQGASEVIKTDFYDEDDIAKNILAGLGMTLDMANRGMTGQNISTEDVKQGKENWKAYRTYMDEPMEADSILGEQMDGLAKSTGQQFFQKAVGGVVPWQLTTALSSMGGEMEQALNEGATFEEAGLSGLISAGGEVISEYMFDADIFGHGSLEEKACKAAGRTISNKVLQSLAKFGMDTTGEGLEEVFSYFVGLLGQKLTYGSDKEISELFTREEAWDSFIGGAIMGGVNSAASGVASKVTGTDYLTGMTKNEKAVVDQAYKERVAEERKAQEGKNLTQKQKKKIYEDVLNSLEKGYLSTDTIEKAVGGQAYEDYQSVMKIQEDNDFLKTYETLGDKQGSTPKENHQWESMGEKAKRIQDSRNALKQKLDAEVARQIQGSKLVESYAERYRRGQTYQADLSQYSGKQKEIVQKAVESGVLNNTNRTHEFVDLISQIAANSGSDYDFTNNARLRASGFAVEGKRVNGYATENGVVVNVDSPKALNRVTGHEITHMLEGTELYNQLQTALYNYAESKGELGARWEYVRDQYKNMKDADPRKELAAELAGDYLFSDSTFVEKLARDNPDIFQKAWDKVKSFCKIAGSRTKEGKQLEKAKQLYEDAYRQAADAKKNATGNGGVKYSISETTDGRPVAVVDTDILKDVDTSNWNKETKKEVRKAATDALRQFKDGFEINGVEYVDNKTTRTEYAKSNYSEALASKEPETFKDKMRAASVVNDVIQVATEWTKDGKLKHKRSDFVDFVRGKTLFQSGDNAYSATVIAGITENGKAIFYDVVDITPDSFEIKKSELPTTVSTGEPSNSILGSSDEVGGSVSTSDTSISPTTNSIASDGQNVKHSLLEDSGSSTLKTGADVFREDIAYTPDPNDLAPIGENVARTAPMEDGFAPTAEDIAKVERAMNDDFAPVREDAPQSVKSAEEGTKLLKEWVEQTTEKKASTPREKVAKEYLETTFTLDNAPDSIKEKYGKTWDKVKTATQEAQNVIIHGDEGVKPLAYIMNKVNQDGFGGEFELYMRHLLNVDRMSLEERGYMGNKPVFPSDDHGQEVTAEMSRKTADQILRAHPEFAEYEQDVRDYVHYLRDKLVECGKITQQTADTWEELYPHYIPLRRRGFQDDYETWQFLESLQSSDPPANSKEGFNENIFRGETATVAQLHEAPGGHQQLYPLMDTLAERTLTTFWNAALLDDGSTDVAPAQAVGTELAPIGDNVVQNTNTPQQTEAANTTPEPMLADYYTERTVLQNELKHLKDSGEDYQSVEKQLQDLERKIKQEESKRKISKKDPFQTETRSKPEPAKRTFTVEENAENLNVETPSTKKAGVDSENSTFEYDRSKFSEEVYKTMDPLKWSREMLLDNGMVFESLSHKTGNKNLDALWNYTRYAPGRAQTLIGEGSKIDGVTGIIPIYDTVKGAGKLDSFYEYLGHCRNIDGMSLRARYGIVENQSFMGMDVSLSDSQKAKIELEAKNPEFKAWAQQCYDFTDYQINDLVKHGILTKENAEMLKDMWEHYVPIKRTADGNNAGILETMAQQTLHIQSAVAMNDFAVELMDTLHSQVSADPVSVDTFVKAFDSSSDLFRATKDENGFWYYFNCYKDGNICKFQISEEMYLALKPTSDLLQAKLPVVADFSELRRKAITEYNLYFAAKNSVKDFQTVLIQSQHPVETYANMPGAVWDILNDGEMYREYLENGGESGNYFNRQTKSLDETAIDKFKKYSGIEAIGDLNNFIESVPRYAEYKVSRMKGASIQVAMLDSARVTTNFAAGGKVTKFINRNGATFLNASVQGAVQLGRTVREAQLNGVKGWLGLAARLAVAGAPELLEHIFWDDDEDYQSLPDYIKEGYYLLTKNEDGTFIRLPKERTLAVIQYGVEQVANATTGNDAGDWNAFFDLCLDNLAPNNPLTNNVFSPMVQVAKNKTWYDTDLVPRRLQDLPTTEQYDEKTDNLSIWLSQKLQDASFVKDLGLNPDLNTMDLSADLQGKDFSTVAAELDLSPKQINYLLDQYSGVIGDLLLPLSTPKAEGKSDSLLGKIALNPLRDIFTTDATLNNRVTGDFYDLMNELEEKAAAPGATMEDKLKSNAMIYYNMEASKLYQQQRELQTSDLTDSEKYTKNREIKAKINELMELALDDLSDIRIDGVYAEVGDDRYNWGVDNDTGEERWFKVHEKDKDGTDNWYYQQEQLSHKNLGMSYADYWNGNYPTDYKGKNLYAVLDGKRYNFDTEKKVWYEIGAKKADGTDNWYYQQEQAAEDAFGVSHKDFWNNRDKYETVLKAAQTWDDETQSYSKPYYTTVRCVLGVDTYATYAEDLANLRADKDANGNSIPGSKKKKVKEYVYNLDIPDIEKHILFKVYYPYTKTHNNEIRDYLNDREDISYGEMKSILEELGATVDEKGYFKWKS